MLVSRGPGRPAWEKGFFVGGGWQDEHVSVWDELVGQDRAVETLRRAVAGGRHAMTHACSAAMAVAGAATTAAHRCPVPIRV